MSIFQAVLMGIIQGLTEFLPISSSGHLVLFEHFFGQTKQQDVTLAIFLHLGSLIAVIVYFNKDLLSLISSLVNWNKSIDQNKHHLNRLIILYLVVATLVTGSVYFVFGDKLTAMFSRPLLVSLMLAVTGLIIFISDKVKKTDLPISNIGIIRSIFIGLGQGIAMIPGISRSGTTIATALFVGLKRDEAARFSFLLSIPAIFAANVSEIKNLTTIQGQMLVNYLIGAIAAFISGYIVIAFLLGLIRRSKLFYFALYCWFVSALTFTLLIRGF